MSCPTLPRDVAVVTIGDEKWVLPLTNIHDEDKAWRVVQHPYVNTVSFHRSLLVATFNLGYFVMANIQHGTEAKQVELCQKRYGGEQDRTISRCTYNAAKFLSHYSLFGLQEVNPIYRSSLEREIGSKFRFVPGDRILVGYDPSVTGPGIAVTPVDFVIPCHPAKDRRGMQVVYFPHLDLLFVNLHAPHNIDLKVEIEACLAPITYKPKRVIMVGDFNDHEGTLLHLHIDVFGKRLRVPGGERINTCCADNGYKSTGDYILVDANEHEYYGRPPNYQRNNPLMSDHDPVVLVSYA
jgi:hypothetical protein